MARTLVPHSRDDQPMIDSFYCSRCAWSLAIRRPVRYRLPYDEVAAIARQFTRHCCQAFEERDADWVGSKSIGKS